MSASQLPTARRTAPDGSQRAPDGSERATDRTTRRATTDRTPDPALVLDRYRLRRRLGAGSFGTVWMAHDERLDRNVAVKVVPRERIVGGRFEREARAAARLTHPGIVTLYEAAIDDDGAYLVSELVVGATLAQLLDAGRLSDRDIVEIAISLADALSYAHSQSIVHRDVKPSNVLIADQPTSRAHPAKLTDFGVARVLGGDSLTRTGDVVGTAAYMAPEQAEGRPAGPPADLYALALITYEALTGVNPVRTGTAAVRARRLGAHLPPLRRQRRDLPRELGRGVDLALRPRPRERGTLDELKAALVASLTETSDAPGVVASPWPNRATARPADHANPVPKLELAAEQTPVQDDAPHEALPIPWPARALGATGAAIAVAWLSSRLLAPLPIAPAALGIVAWLIVLMAPRIGWLALAAALAVGALARHHPGGAIVVAIAALIPVVLTPRRGTTWPLAVGAPLLGIVGLAGAWPAVAARAGAGMWRRAALGATGYIWLTIAAPLAGTSLYMRLPPETPDPQAWTGSLTETAQHVIKPLLTSGVLVAAPVWAIGAAVLPLILKTRHLSTAVVLVTVWSAVLLSATETAIVAFHGAHAAASPPSALAGAAVGALIALAPALTEAWRKTPHTGNAKPELP